MAIKTYTVTLNEEVVERAKKRLTKNGAKLSPVINNLLADWVKEQNEMEDNKK